MSNEEGSTELVEGPLSFSSVRFPVNEEDSPIRSDPDVSPSSVGILVDVVVWSGNVISDEFDV